MYRDRLLNRAAMPRSQRRAASRCRADHGSGSAGQSAVPLPPPTIAQPAPRSDRAGMRGGRRSGPLRAPAHAHGARAGGRATDQDRRHRLVVDRRRRRKLAGGVLSEPARGRAQARMFPRSEITVLNRGVNGEDRARHAGAVRARRDRGKARSGDLAGRHATRCCATIRCSRTRSLLHDGIARAQGDRRRRRADRSAIRAQGASPSPTPTAWSI